MTRWSPSNHTKDHIQHTPFVNNRARRPLDTFKLFGPSSVLNLQDDTSHRSLGMSFNYWLLGHLGKKKTPTPDYLLRLVGDLPQKNPQENLLHRAESSRSCQCNQRLLCWELDFSRCCSLLVYWVIPLFFHTFCFSSGIDVVSKLRDSQFFHLVRSATDHPPRRTAVSSTAVLSTEHTYSTHSTWSALTLLQWRPMPMRKLSGLISLWMKFFVCTYSILLIIWKVRKTS